MVSGWDWWELIKGGLLVVAALSGVVVAWEKLRRADQDRTKSQGRWEGEADADRALFKDFMERVDDSIEQVKSDVNEVRTYLIERFGPLRIRPQSPLQLTMFGEEISERAAASQWVSRVVGGNIMHSVKARDAYEIQKICFDYAADPSHYNKEETTIIHGVAYEKGLKADEVRQVLAIVLRDAILERTGLVPPHKEEAP